MTKYEVFHLDDGGWYHVWREEAASARKALDGYANGRVITGNFLVVPTGNATVLEVAVVETVAVIELGPDALNPTPEPATLTELAQDMLGGAA